MSFVGAAVTTAARALQVRSMGHAFSRWRIWKWLCRAGACTPPASICRATRAFPPGHKQVARRRLEKLGACECYS